MRSEMREEMKYGVRVLVMLIYFVILIKTSISQALFLAINNTFGATTGLVLFLFIFYFQFVAISLLTKALLQHFY